MQIRLLVLPFVFGLMAGFGLAPDTAAAADTAASRAAEQLRAAKDANQEIEEEFQYRAQVDQGAALWAKDLMYLYEWSKERKLSLSPEGAQNILRRTIPGSMDELKRVLDAELAWSVVSLSGFLAPYDLVHAEQSIIGSRSRLASALLQSTPFWKEVRGHCLRIEPRENLKTCGQRLRQDLEVSQAVSSNVSLFLAGGLLFKLGKVAFKKYLAGWVSVRFGGWLATIQASRPAMIGLASTAIAVPAGLILAAVLDEREMSGAYLADLEKTMERDLKRLKDEQASASMLYGRQFELKQAILRFSIWLHQNVPPNRADPVLAEQFVVKLRMEAPSYQMLCEAEPELSRLREQVEMELSAVPNVSQRLIDIVAKQASSEELTEEEHLLYSRAQLLASLRLSLKALLACEGAH